MLFLPVMYSGINCLYFWKYISSIRRLRDTPGLLYTDQVLRNGVPRQASLNEVGERWLATSASSLSIAAAEMNGEAPVQVEIGPASGKKHRRVKLFFCSDEIKIFCRHFFPA
jgi:hypothetical protein